MMWRHPASQQPGLYLAGKISSGTVKTGDRLNLLDGETVVREVACGGIELVDADIHHPELALVAVPRPSPPAPRR